MAWSSFVKTSDAKRLLAALRNACSESSEWIPFEVDAAVERASGCDCFLADYKGAAFAGKSLGLFVGVWPDRPDKARVTMHAERWPEDRTFPTDVQYAHAEDLAAPLFQNAGRLLGRRLKLRRPKPDTPRPLRGALEGALRAVTVVYERTTHPAFKPRSLHPNDQERFWRFIRVAHQYQSTLRPSDVAFHLGAAGFHEELVTALQDEYRIGRQILALHHRPWDLRRIRKEERRRREREDAAEYERVFGKPRETGG